MRPKSLLSILNMNAGFLGIQFGWSLQMANMSAIYEQLGANPEQIPMLWLAAPLTGLLVQPIIGHMSDHTWGPLGRRRPYFLTGALLSTAALVAMPNAPSLAAAACLLWVLDASINVSMEPFRAFVTDLLPDAQRTLGFAVQSLFIGLAAVVASSMPYILTQLGVQAPVKVSFYMGAVAFFCFVMWTVVSTSENPPDPDQEQQESRPMLADILQALREMPQTMRDLAPVQICTWLGLFCMWLYFGVAVAHNYMGASDPQSDLYKAGVAWGGVCFAAYSVVTFLFSFGLNALAERLGRRRTHALCLTCGGLGLLSVAVMPDHHWLLLSMAGVGVAWASILAMPYAILAGSLPARRTGLYMGIFNFFIVLPEIAASLGFGWVIHHVLGDNRLAAVAVGGIFMLLAAGLVLRVREPVPPAAPEES